MEVSICSRVNGVFMVKAMPERRRQSKNEDEHAQQKRHL